MAQIISDPAHTSYELKRAEALRAFRLEWAKFTAPHGRLTWKARRAIIPWLRLELKLAEDEPDTHQDGRSPRWGGSDAMTDQDARTAWHAWLPRGTVDDLIATLDAIRRAQRERGDVMGEIRASLQRSKRDSGRSRRSPLGKK